MVSRTDGGNSFALKKRPEIEIVMVSRTDGGNSFALKKEPDEEVMLELASCIG
ncbi:MAG: hypothetical protein HDS62_04500 [Bacteroidales bacterium]|nr:hypothetical protein [Bacteroidales bacterium]